MTPRRALVMAKNISRAPNGRPYHLRSRLLRQRVGWVEHLRNPSHCCTCLASRAQMSEAISGTYFSQPAYRCAHAGYACQLCPTGKSLPRSAVPPRESIPSRKNFPLSPSGKSILELPPSRAPQRGVSRSSRHVGRGMRWMRRRQA